MQSQKQKKDPQLNVESVSQILEPGGILSQVLPGFEARLEQQKMMRNVLDAYHRKTITLIEAGTGTGKSMAYLIPALLWAAQHQERTLISTNTINLQEQLIHKDIPLLIKALKLDVKAVLVKGMSNYLCLRKMADVHHELRFLPSDEAKELEKIEAWAHSTQDGSRSDLSFVPSGSTWEHVCAESDTCTHKKCPHYEKCFFFKARRHANEAQILVANHHMLFADLAYRAQTENYSNPAVLPLYSRIVLDEAHNIEDIATDYFAMRTSHLGLMRLMSRLTSEKHGKLHMLMQKLYDYYRKGFPKEIKNIMQRLDVELPSHKNEVLHLIALAFQGYTTFIQSLQPSNQSEEGANTENKLRMLPQHQCSPGWTEGVIPNTKRLVDVLKKFVVALQMLEREIENLKDERLNELTHGLRSEITAFANRLEAACNVMDSFASTEVEPTKVRWVESQQLRTKVNTQLVEGEIDISKRLVDYLFSKFPTIVLCSATLTTNQDFQFIRKRLGLTDQLQNTHAISEHMYESPFNYSKQALFAIPVDIPSPTHPEFNGVATEKIWEAIQASQGNAFVLFTSYSMLKSCHQALFSRLESQKYTVLKQGDDNRQSLLQRFRKTDRSVLFGTDSFWEGVDVVGDALRCVIIVKLPFRVPTEPIIQARTEAILAQGGDPFMEYSLPNAIVKFKQGFGRLIRNKTDRGCVVCLDSRLLNKGYGKQFLNSLPACTQVFGEGQMIQKQMMAFYKATHHLAHRNE